MFHNGLDVTPALLAQTWIPDNVVEAIEAKRNDYEIARLSGEPKKRQREVQVFGICHFLAIFYYMGIFRLPQKYDYWSKTRTLLSPPIVDGMARNRFIYIWQHLHL